ncbi:MAG: hypothetical protein M1816_000875 [Peltula sp. TS41687]|nr:MAG: hypothetical protein M1816_000875 [Peltula sp. TS41687]
MAPDRGRDESEGLSSFAQVAVTPLASPRASPPHDEASSKATSKHHAAEGHHFTIRGVAIGCVVGILICFSNTFFGLQTGWVSGMAMPASLIGFAFFKAVAKHLDYPFSPVENVLVQTVAGAVGTMPLGCGFVGVVPALEYLLTPAENGPLRLGLGRLVVWSLGLAFFGVVFGVPLRKQVIIREKLRFPSGTATALMIGLLHGQGEKDTGRGDGEMGMEAGGGARNTEVAAGSAVRGDYGMEEEEQRLLISQALEQQSEGRASEGALDERQKHVKRMTAGLSDTSQKTSSQSAIQNERSWRLKIRLLAISFLLSSIYTLITYFIPQLHHIPFLGSYLASNWLWTFNLSPAYLAQGIIMGPATTFHMLLGAIVGWTALSPLAKKKGWAPGPVKDWEHGSKGWIVWISLAIMLADSLVNLGWLAGRPLLGLVSRYLIPSTIKRRGWKKRFMLLNRPTRHNYTAVDVEEDEQAEAEEDSTLLYPTISTSTSTSTHPPPSTKPTIAPITNPPGDRDAPPSQQISARLVLLSLGLSLSLCIISIHATFPHLIPLHATLLSLPMSFLLSIMGVRAMGETDLNPVSGISKLTQLVFALLIIPRSNPHAITINLIAGAVSEAGALQAGDLLQDLKTGHLLGASPKAQFYGQLIGSFVGAIASAAVYRLYTNVYAVPGDQFPVPTAYVWIFTARLVTGKGLPPRVAEWATGAGALFAASTVLRIVGAGTKWQGYVPGGIAVAVGMYNTPSFTLARALGGFATWYWVRYRDYDESVIIIVASGLILGEGVCSIVNLALAAWGVPHL